MRRIQMSERANQIGVSNRNSFYLVGEVLQRVDVLVCGRLSR